MMKAPVSLLVLAVRVATASLFHAGSSNLEGLVQREANANYDPPRYPPSGGHGRHGCLTAGQVDSILSRWPLIFEALYTGIELENLINSTVTKDFTSFDGTWQFLTNGSLQTTSRAQLIAQSQSQYDTRDYGPSAPSGRFSKVFSFFDCNHIAFRFVYKSVTTGKTQCTHTTQSQAGLPIEFYGTDLLFIKPGTLLIQKCFTSADWIVDFLEVGADFTGSPICPAVPSNNTGCPS